MSIRCTIPLRAARLVALAALAAPVTPAASQAQYSLLDGSGQQYRLGDVVSIPIATPSSVPATGTMFPPLRISRTASATVMQAPGATSMTPPKITVPPGAFARVPAGPTKVCGKGPTMAQIRTRLSFSAPGSFPSTPSNPAVLRAGGRTGAHTTTLPGVPGGSIARYSGSAHQFGGPLQSKVVAVSPIGFWHRLPEAMAPCKHPAFGGLDADCTARRADWHPRSRWPIGGPVGFTTTTPGTPVSSPGFLALSVDSQGCVQMSTPLADPGTTNMATSVGFPWTTGMLTLSQPNVLGTPEKFVITGRDDRTIGSLGTISLVSGSLSDRSISGPNANRGWMRLVIPEPSAGLGVGAALAALALCRALVRRPPH